MQGSTGLSPFIRASVRHRGEDSRAAEPERRLAEFRKVPLEALFSPREVGIEGDRVPQMPNAVHRLTLTMQNNGEVVMRLGKVRRPLEHRAQPLLCAHVVPAKVQVYGSAQGRKQVAGRALGVARVL